MMTLQVVGTLVIIVLLFAMCWGPTLINIMLTLLWWC